MSVDGGATLGRSGRRPSGSPRPGPGGGDRGDDRPRPRGPPPPSAEQVAARAGVSLASLFRYFETLDELRRETIRRYLERFAHLIDIAECGSRLAGRAHRTVRRRPPPALRDDEPIGRLAQSGRDRARHRPQPAPDPGRPRRAGPPGTSRPSSTAADARRWRDDLVAIVSTTTSFESWLQLRDDYARGAARHGRAWTNALRCLLNDP